MPTDWPSLPSLSTIVSYTLPWLAVLLTGASVVMFSLFLYANVLESYLAEVRSESEGGVRGMFGVAIRRLGVHNRKLLWPSYETKVRRNLVKAGEPNGFGPEDILALQEVGAVFGLLFGLWLMYSLGFNVLFGLPVAVLGGYYPLIWVSDQVKKRHLKIARALPYNLDLLTLSVEAGLDFTGALAKVVEKGKQGPLRDELQLVLKQLKMGKTREDALKSMVTRVDLPPLTLFVTALIQADRMGTSLGRVLRIQSTQMRIDRTQRAEKLAGEAPVKMLFPLIACIFPTVFMVLFGPIIFAMTIGKAAG